MSKKYTTTVREASDGELWIELDSDLLEQAGLSVGDSVRWTDRGDGSWSLQKVQPTQLVLVEAVSVFRMRYMVEVPADHAEWALDVVTMNNAAEFSQKHLDETIVSHRVVSREEALELCRKDNDYASGWTDDKLVSTFFTADDSVNTKGTVSKIWPFDTGE